IEAQVMQLHGFTGIFETATLYAPFQRYSIRKHSFNVPFMSDGITCVADALMRIDEGASMLVNHVASSSKPSELHKTYKNIERLYGEIEEFRRRSPVLKSGQTISERDKYIEEYLFKTNKVNKPNVKSEGLKIADAPTAMMNLPRPIRKDLLLNVIETGRFPVPFYAHGAITSPEDVAMLRCMGCDGVILSVNVFEGRFIDQKLKGAVQASQHWDNNDLLATICEDIGAYVKY
ncbi:Pyridoxal 5'-phosphate synthase subunit snz1, partial [Coemansia sp. RSA 552]